jgi:hypothetical protein
MESTRGVVERELEAADVDCQRVNCGASLFQVGEVEVLY